MESIWSEDHETILIEWADKAMCYKWLHNKSNSYYSKLNAIFTIPVIILSTLTGAANLAIDRFPIEQRSHVSLIIGGVNIAAGIISTIQQFYKISELNEAHYASSIAWDKFYRNIKCELSKHPDERNNVIQMIKACKEEFDRLIETSPTIDNNIIKQFNLIPNIKEIKFKKPEICDELISTEEFRHKWFTYKNSINNTIKEDKTKYIEFKKQFFELNNRNPTEQEIIDNLRDTLDMKDIKNIDKLLGIV